MDGTTSRRVIGLATEVHRQRGPGLLESIYHAWLMQELTCQGIGFEQEVELPIVYKGVALGRGYRIDLIVGQRLVVEVKSVQQILPVHRAQLLTYLRLTKLRAGLLLNFHSAVLKDGIVRLVTEFPRGDRVGYWRCLRLDWLSSFSPQRHKVEFIIY
jgi:GxxExxY protein